MILLWTYLILMLSSALAIMLFPAWNNIRRDTNQPNSYKTLLAIAIFFCSFSLIAYYHWGHSQALEQYLVQHKATQQRLALQQQIGLSVPDMIQQLKARLVANTQDAKGWYLLGRLYFNQEDFHAAATAFAKANQLQNNNPDFMMQYVQASYLANHEKLTANSKQLLEKVLALEPDNALALNLSAVTAYQQGKYQIAIQFWQRLLPRYPSDSVESQALQAGIANAQQKLAH